MAKTNNNSDKDNDVLVAIFGKNTFVKVYQAIEIGKIKFSFVNKENPKDNIDCYLDCDIFNCDLINLITNKDYNGVTTLEKLAVAERKAYAEKKANANGQTVYHSPIWVSPTGVSNGNVVRKFELQPADNTDFAFRATEGKKYINVGCEARLLKLLAERWNYLKPDYDAYMRAKYNKDAMKNQYHAHKEDDAPTQYFVDDSEKDASVPQTQQKNQLNENQQKAQAQKPAPKQEEAPVRTTLIFKDKDITQPLTLCKNSDTKYYLKVGNDFILFEQADYKNCKEWENMKNSLTELTPTKISLEVDVSANGYKYFKSLNYIMHDTVIQIKTTDKLVLQDNTYVVKSVCDDKPIQVIFDDDSINTCNMWNEMKRRLSQEVGIKIRMNVFIDGSKVYFNGLPKAS